MRLLTFLLFLLPAALFSYQKPHIVHEHIHVEYEPWLTGPVLAPSANTPEIGSPAIEPILTLFCTYGDYDENWKVKSEKNIWAINPLVLFTFAVSEKVGVEVLGSFISSYQGSKHSTHWQDTIALIGYQVAQDQKDSWIPDFRLLIEATFPTGRHDDLDSDKDGIDSTGQGAYFLGPGFVFQKLFYLPHHFFVLHGSAAYFFPTRAKMKGMSAYGGGKGTKGTIEPGGIFTAFLSGEYSFSQRWAIASDIMFLHQNSASDFRGVLGVTPTGAPAIVGLAASTQVSLSPGIEYNFSAYSGMIFGSWFTVAGRNTDAFVSAYIAYLHIF